MSHARPALKLTIGRTCSFERIGVNWLAVHGFLAHAGQKKASQPEGCEAWRRILTCDDMPPSFSGCNHLK